MVHWYSGSFEGVCVVHVDGDMDVVSIDEESSAVSNIESG